MHESLEALKDNIVHYALVAGGILFTLLLAGVLCRVVKRIIARSYAKRSQNIALERRRKLETASTITQSASTYIIWFLAAAAIIGQLGLTTTMNSMLAAAGIGGLALGIGAQSFIKDVVAGIFIVLEDQASVGDYVSAAGVMGVIEEISLRTIVIKSVRGEINIIPNGAIAILTNYSRSDYLALVEISIAYESDASRAMELMREVASDYANENENAVDKPEVLGVTALSSRGITLRLVMKVKPLTHWATERALMLKIKQRFEAENIVIPHNKRMLYKGEGE